MSEQGNLRDAASRTVKNTFADMFGVSPDSVTDATVAGDVKGWDSTTHVGLILAIEEELGIEFGIERVGEFENVGDLIDAAAELLSAKG